MQLKVRYRKDGKTISFMRLYCSSALHKKGYCVREHKGIELQSITQIVISNLEKKVKKIINEDDLEKLLEDNYKPEDESNFDKELKVNRRLLEKTNTIISSLYIDYKNGFLQECDYKNMYKSETEKRDTINNRILEIEEKMNNNKKISKQDFQIVSKKVSNVKKWTREQLADIIDKVEIDKDNRIFINYKYDILNLI